MKNLLAIATALGLMIIPFAAYAQSEQAWPVAAQPEQAAAKAPPVSQELVPEGDFALKLATALKLGAPETEAQAEDMLMAAGIAPKNGWIADYPMTPIVIGQVRDSVVAAGALNKLPTGKDEALQGFDGLTAEFGLSISAPSPGEYAETPAPTSSEYVPPPEIENYYYEEGPPIVTYYPPPWDYNYLYAWVPYPFWCSGFFFPGFFILNDFHHSHHHHHHHDDPHHGHHDDSYHGRHLISNHFTDPKTHASLRVDPTTRTTGVAATRVGALRSPEANRGAASIFNRGANSRTFRQPGNAGKYQNFRGSRIGGGRSFGSLPGRSFSRPSGRSFSAPSSSGRNSFGGSQGGGLGGFHYGGHGSFQGKGHN